MLFDRHGDVSVLPSSVETVVLSTVPARMRGVALAAASAGAGAATGAITTAGAVTTATARTAALVTSFIGDVTGANETCREEEATKPARR